MRPLMFRLALLASWLTTGNAVAAVLPVADVRAASATLSADGRELVVRASVDLPNGCWTEPRILAPGADAAPDADGVATLTVVADSSAGAGHMCSMMFRRGVEASPVTWTGFPAGLKAVRLLGSRTPVTATISAADASRE